MYIIKLSTQQHNGIYDTTNNLKIIISVRGGELTFFAVFSLIVTLTVASSLLCFCMLVARKKSATKVCSVLFMF